MYTCCSIIIYIIRFRSIVNCELAISMNTDLLPDFQETTCITFEWTLRGLKNLFDSTKGEHKSKVTKSPLFGGGRWQVRDVSSCRSP